MSLKRFFFNFVIVFVLLAALDACRPPATTTAPPDTATPGQPTLTHTPEAPAEWAAPENWWRKPQVWIQNPDMGWDYEDLSKAGLTVASWIFDISAIQALHDQGLIVVGDDSMMLTYKSSFSGGLVPWDPSSGAPPALVDAAIRDPFGNIFSDDWGFKEWFGSDDRFVTYSATHPDWYEHKLQRMKAFIDAGTDGYLLDELAYGSFFFPDFNPYTLQQFNTYLLETYSKEELAALGEPWGIDDFANLDYAALVRDHLPAGMTAMTRVDWENWELTHNIPLINQYRRFLRVESQKVALRLIRDGRVYAEGKYDKYLPISVNLNDLISPEAWFLMDELDFYSNEFPYDQYGYFPTARPIASLKLAQYFDTPLIVLTQMTTRPDIRTWGSANTVNLYRTMIADAYAGGGAFHIETNLHNMVQDMDAIGPYYHFASNYPLLFEDLEPMTGNIGLLHLWETVAYYSKAHVGLSDLLADAGYQFGAFFGGAEEFIQWGGETETPAPDLPLKADDLARYKAVIIPELYNLTENHAEILIQYVQDGGTLIIFSTQDTTGDMDASLPLLGQILAARGKGATEIGEGKLIHINGVWGKDFLENPDPSTRVQLSQLLEAERFQPEVRMTGTRYLAATAYTGSDRMAVHFVNYDHRAGADITTPTGPVEVEITLPEGFQLGKPALYLFTPGERPVEIKGELKGNKLRLTLPSVYIWSVLLIGEQGIIQPEVAAIPSPTPSPIPTSTPVPTPTLSAEQRAVAGYVIYDEALRHDWYLDQNSQADMQATDMVHGDQNSIQVTLSGGYAFALGAGSLNISDYDYLEFYINGGLQGGQELAVFLWDPVNGEVIRQVNLADYIQMSRLPANEWLLVDIPLTDLNPDNLPIDTINITAVSQPAEPFYVDDIRFFTAGP